MKPLTLKQVEDRIGDVVYVEDLTVKSYPRKTYPSVVFEWRLKDPFSAEFDLSERVQEVTAIQPSAYAGHTVYWKSSEYGQTWLAYTKPMLLWRE